MMVNRLEHRSYEIELSRDDKHIDPLLFRTGDIIIIRKIREWVDSVSKRTLSTTRFPPSHQESITYNIIYGAIDLSNPILKRSIKDDRGEY